jgi:16S rRNA U516 pseudouridylate synthase RsuA-like enzyme
MSRTEIGTLASTLDPPPAEGLAWYRAVLRQGWKRQLRRMFGAVGAPIERLARIGIGPVALGTLPSGGVRRLRQREVDELARGRA